MLLVCLFFVERHYLLLSPVGPRGFSFVTFGREEGGRGGGGGVGWPFYGEGHFKNLIGFRGHFYKFYESSKKAVTSVN